ncbi:hypothetical protein O6H91_09G003200 [Diphasiastrum complanatum]|uniref:Uncharacterized protein n=1 Tax=Diphasiastrum complanatum TaxID=34168 RepID=A0ACC2CKU8_DIPCM|nr:hypothetical protein O6H91_09G003200 [Diphasiastrum complanatum]
MEGALAKSLHSCLYENARTSFRHNLRPKINVNWESFRRRRSGSLQGHISSSCGEIMGGTSQLSLDLRYEIQCSRISDVRRSFACSRASLSAPGPQFGSGSEMTAEQLWREFFSDTSRWWDQRFEKKKDGHPDFKHKTTQEALWIESGTTPDWVKERLGTLKPRVIERSNFTWNVQISQLVKNGQHMKALQLYDRMQAKHVSPDKFTFIPILKACAIVGALQHGRLIHEHIARSGCEVDVFVGSCLVDMYAKCGSIAEACGVFYKMPEHDVVSWSAMIMGYAKCGQGQKALHLFQQMQQGKVEPNRVTYVGVLNACASLGAIEEGRLVHKQIIQSGLDSDLFVANCLIDMYVKCGSVQDAHRVFKEMPRRNVVSWSAMIMGYVKLGQGRQALKLFRWMQHEQVKPDKLAFLAVLSACASAAALEEGKFVHRLVIQRQLQSDLHVGSSLVDMYSKCGSIEDARKVFDSMPTCNVVAWTSMIGGYALHGLAKDAFLLFDRMCQEGVELDNGTFVSLLSAWTHSGQVAQGVYFFESMNPVYGIQATLKHYTCMVDLLGRSGLFDEAEDTITNMPWQPDSCVWTTLLGACRLYGKLQMARRIAKRIFALETVL